mmetsp:Transcript_15456/g.22796  ORF Transcript_15456/g.22796 Transcript_15456/m.22796 type:complete len:303 (+) Transcript_15456:57-965(+)|eukprot:CAMPEP_0195524642 /NCGR_PEP_ID=MMETSP0794_2-20130614/24561_1 /TAXON_ID=515487 /ORGANISM="Stephanopyxis turris, Strain CCMP 815" /LENGTH=302 /DNA_ID=CAMNT_0040654897 /DNA_START=45 /DNA_END=953 /DNA_ORIENTATION=-
MFFLLAVLLHLPVISHSSSSTSSRSSPSSEFFKEQCKFVSASPLSVAAVCSDGIAILAAHTAPLYEPLLVKTTKANDNVRSDGSSPESDETIEKEMSSTDGQEKNEMHLDLPSDYRGPTRIELIDELGTSIVCAGWRTDCSSLAAKCQSIVSAEADRYGSGVSSIEDNGRFLAQSASLWMSNCAFSDSVRSLSCVGIIASCGVSGSCIWLIDATGFYRARAIAVGMGAKAVNERLCQIDFSGLTKEEGAQKLLTLVTNDEDHDSPSTWKLPSGSLVEAAVIGASEKHMKRLRQPFLRTSARN